MKHSLTFLILAGLLSQVFVVPVYASISAEEEPIFTEQEIQKQIASFAKQLGKTITSETAIEILSAKREQERKWQRIVEEQAEWLEREREKQAKMMEEIWKQAGRKRGAEELKKYLEDPRNWREGRIYRSYHLEFDKLRERHEHLSKLADIGDLETFLDKSFSPPEDTGGYEDFVAELMKWEPEAGEPPEQPEGYREYMKKVARFNDKYWKHYLGPAEIKLLELEWEVEKLQSAWDSRTKSIKTIKELLKDIPSAKAAHAKKPKKKKPSDDEKVIPRSLDDKTRAEIANRIERLEEITLEDFEKKTLAEQESTVDPKAFEEVTELLDKNLAFIGEYGEKRDWMMLRYNWAVKEGNLQKKLEAIAKINTDVIEYNKETEERATRPSKARRFQLTIPIPFSGSKKVVTIDAKPVLGIGAIVGIYLIYRWYKKRKAAQQKPELTPEDREAYINALVAAGDNEEAIEDILEQLKAEASEEEVEAILNEALNRGARGLQAEQASKSIPQILKKRRLVR